MVFSVSPSVTVREVDLTTTVPAITTPPAAIAGVFRWGPVNERVLVSSEIELANIFGTPTDFNAETFFAAADFLSYSNALYVTRVVSTDAERAVEDASGTAYFQAKHFGELGNSLQVSYVSVSDTIGEPNNFEDELFDSAIFNDTGTEYEGLVDYNIQFGTNQIQLEIPEDFQVGSDGANLKVGDTLRIGNADVGFQELVVAALTATSETIETEANTEVEIFTYNITFDRNYTLTETDAQQLQFVRRWKYAYLFETAPAAGDFHIVVTDKDGSITGQAGTVVERFNNLSTSPSAKFADGANRYYVDVLANRSAWIEATDESLTDVFVRSYNDLAGGTNGNNENSISLGAIARGYDLYREGNEVDISFVIQGKPSTNLANYLISNIAEYRKDCMLFLSPDKNSVVGIASPQTQLNNILAYRNALQNSSYWFMDSGYKYRYDKYNDVFRWVPLNGDMAGLASLVQPWESPAGYRKGRVRNVIKLAFNPNKSQRDQLYGKDVNPVLTQAGSGTILFGDKTGLGTATGSAFTRINVRRLFLTVEKAIATISAQLLFEFNDEFTQNQFRQIVDPFLRDIQGRRGIIDFRVISDATVNTPQVIDSNTFRANIFIKPARSINFIELTFVATRTGVEFEEIVGQQF
jgi:hypothetical protein